MCEHTLAGAVLDLQRGAGNAAVQRWLHRQPALKPKPKINYMQAERRNKNYADKLGWKDRLAALKPELAEAWKKDPKTFADAVAAFQLTQKGLKPDGELGPGTWNRIRPIGEVIAERNVNLEASQKVCTMATQERLLEGWWSATGTGLVGKGQHDDFRVILQSISSRMPEVDEKYRATGAAGALVYLGKGTFVDQKGIWDDKLLMQGAAMQVWRRQSDVERVKRGEEPKSIGTSFVFLKYDEDDENAMKVKHFGKVETQRKGDWEFWVGANPVRP